MPSGGGGGVLLGNMTKRGRRLKREKIWDFNKDYCKTGLRERKEGEERKSRENRCEAIYEKIITVYKSRLLTKCKVKYYGVDLYTGYK